MKFMEMRNLLKTNILFSRLQLFDPKKTIEIEAYSCKQTKDQKRHKFIPKPLRFYISALELTFPDYDFSNEKYTSFKPTHIDYVKKEISFLFLTIYKNNNDASEFLTFFETVLGQVINLKNSKIFLVDIDLEGDSGYLKTFLFYDKKLKRILILKTNNQK